MPNYQLSKIYKIVPLNSEDDNDVYIGSTCKTTLAERMTQHRYKYRSWKNGNKESNISSFRLFEKYGLENCHIYLIINYPCNNKDELRRLEGHYITNIPCVNKIVPGRSDKESSKISREKHKIKRNILKRTQYRCICGGYYTRCHKAVHKTTQRHIVFLQNYIQLMNEIDELLEDIKKFKPLKLILN
jgi:hypothetical protein